MSVDSRTSKKIAILISYISIGVKLLVTFALTPFILDKLGKSEYGLYQLVFSTVSYLSLLGFGFSSSYLRFYSRFKVKNDEESIMTLNGMFMTVFLIMSILCILAGVIINTNIDLVFGNNITKNEYITAKVILIILVINMSLSFPAGMFICNTTAHEKFIFQKGISLFSNILSPILQILFLINGCKSVGLSMAVLITSFIELFINIIYNCVCLKIRFRFGKYDLLLFKEIIYFTFFIFLNQILDMLSSSNIDNFLIGRISGTDDVTIYSMGSKFSTLFYSIIAPVSAVFVPTIYKIVETDNEKNKLSEIFVKVGKYQFAILVMIISCFILFGKKFMYIWIGNGYNESYYIAIILMLSLIVALSQNIGIEIQRAENKHQIRSIVYLLIDIGNIFISIPLIKVFGPIGAAIGTAIAMLFGTVIFMNFYYKFAIGINIKEYWKNIFNILFKMIPCLIIGYILKITFVQVEFKILLFQILMYFLIYAVSFYYFVLEKNERKRVLIKKIWRKR